MESAFFLPLSERMMLEDKMNELSNSFAFEQEKERVDQATLPELEPDSSVIENARLIEERRQLIEKRLAESLISPSTRLYRAIWSVAAGISRLQLETGARKRSETAADRSSSEGLGTYIKRIAELIRSYVSTRIILPLIRQILSNDDRTRLRDYRRDYAELLRIREASLYSEGSLTASDASSSMTHQT